MTNHDDNSRSDSDRAPEWLATALRELPEELSPTHDLWPDIAKSLDRKPALWTQTAIAASIIFSVASAGFTWYLWQQRNADRAAFAAAEKTINSIQTPYESARVSYQQQLPQLLQNLDPETAGKVQRNLELIHKASADIAGALHKDPNDPVMRELLLKTYEQELSLYQQLQKIAVQSI